MSGSAPRIVIIGAGIGGLTLALALRQRGFEPRIFEQAAQLTEIGAAIALSANGTRELDRLGCLDALTAVSTEPTELIFRGWASDARIASFPVRDQSAYAKRFGAPYFGVHRADLQQILSARLGGEGLNLDHKLEALSEERRGITLRFRNGQCVEADIVIGADGVRSAVRSYVAGVASPVYSRTSAFRGIIPIEALDRLPDPEAIQFWMGPRAHMLHYAIGGAQKAVNYFAVVEGPSAWSNPAGSTAPVDHRAALDAFSGWHPAVTQMIDAAPHSLRWGLFTVPPVRRWFRGRAVLMGDSVHGMLPHHGQGANTTIEDAVTLATLLASRGRADLDASFRLYQSLRQSRTRTIQRSAWDTNRLLHLDDGPALVARDARVATFPQAFGWIHAFDALADAQSAISSGVHAGRMADHADTCGV